MLSSVDLFISFMMFLIFYGVYLKIWNQSRTTILVILVVTLSAVISKFFEVEIVYLFVSMAMFMLFVRAVFRKKIIASKYRDLFYA